MPDKRSRSDSADRIDQQSLRISQFCQCLLLFVHLSAQFILKPKSNQYPGEVLCHITVGSRICFWQFSHPRSEFIKFDYQDVLLPPHLHQILLYIGLSSMFPVQSKRQCFADVGNVWKEKVHLQGRLSLCNNERSSIPCGLDTFFIKEMSVASLPKNYVSNQLFYLSCFLHLEGPPVSTSRGDSHLQISPLISKNWAHWSEAKLQNVGLSSPRIWNTPVWPKVATIFFSF